MLVVVDAGHGGTDPGATGHGLKEATLTLKIAKRLRAALLRDFDAEVALTRSADRAVELHCRAKIANDLGADYFVSVHIHCGGEQPVGWATVCGARCSNDVHAGKGRERSRQEEGESRSPP
jgi:N-acetylmuramoyl-L-alanine amidase